MFQGVDNARVLVILFDSILNIWSLFSQFQEVIVAIVVKAKDTHVPLKAKIIFGFAIIFLIEL